MFETISERIELAGKSFDFGIWRLSIKRIRELVTYPRIERGCVLARIGKGWKAREREECPGVKRSRKVENQEAGIVLKLYVAEL